jgi:hypothetical protein
MFWEKKSILMSKMKGQTSMQWLMHWNMLLVVNVLVWSFQGSCFGHAFSKACQCGSTNEIGCKNLKQISIKSTQIDL